MNKLKKSDVKQTRKRGNAGWKYFDNCPICLAMKEGRANTAEELKKAFDEADRLSALKTRKNSKR